MIIYWKRLYEDLVVLYYIDCMMFYMLLYYCTLFLQLREKTKNQTKKPNKLKIRSQCMKSLLI